jgi:hypothetical protein
MCAEIRVGLELQLGELKRVETKLESFVSRFRNMGFFLSEVERIVADEYQNQFASRGTYFGHPAWTGPSGNQLDMVDLNEFRPSFSPGNPDWRTTLFLGNGFAFSFRIRNTHRKSNKGLRTNHLAFYEKGARGGGFSVRITGKIGGISRRGSKRVFRAYREHFKKSLISAGFSER